MTAYIHSPTLLKVFNGWRWFFFFQSVLQIFLLGDFMMENQIFSEANNRHLCFDSWKPWRALNLEEPTLPTPHPATRLFHIIGFNCGGGR